MQSVTARDQRRSHQLQTPSARVLTWQQANLLPPHEAVDAADA